ncbi:hypothetical protein niasHT_025623 [Heterodera trifolii]|uniref:Uncharacterized protein n=1 Tax=Heterodera trifolii TaxID=157864 RepID=A0ABD2KHP4_9BILA
MLQNQVVDVVGLGVVNRKGSRPYGKKITVRAQAGPHDQVQYLIVLGDIDDVLRAYEWNELGDFFVHNQVIEAERGESEDEQCQIQPEKLIRYPGFNYSDDNCLDKDSHHWVIPPWDTFVQAQQHHIDTRRHQQTQDDNDKEEEQDGVVANKRSKVDMDLRTHSDRNNGKTKDTDTAENDDKVTKRREKRSIGKRTTKKLGKKRRKVRKKVRENQHVF